MLLETIKFLIYLTLIIIISKYILVETLRKLAESLNLKPKTIGNIAGLSTSVPELLTITTSSLRGLAGVSIYNILSSNVINLLQYLSTILVNKNVNKLKNHAIKIDMILVFVTILIPIFILRFNIKIDIFIVPIYIILYVLFVFLNNNVHKIYLDENEINAEKKEHKKNYKKILQYISILSVTTVLLFFIGEQLGDVLERLCNFFNISQVIIGILLGVVTSLPELITFFESQKYNNKVKDEMKGVVEATNNLLTSNILNLFIIQTIGILITNL